MTLDGKNIAFAGELLYLEREEAVRLAEAAGAVALGRVSGKADLLVLGLDGWQLDPAAGREELIERAKSAGNRELSLMTEAQFLEAVGAADRLKQFQTQYTPAQLSRIVDVGVAQIRRWIRAGLLKPARVVNRLPWFDFSGLSHARKLKHLTESGVSLAAVKRAVTELAQMLPDSAGLIAHLEPLYSMPVVRKGGGSPAELSGQMLLEFIHDHEEPSAGVQDESSTASTSEGRVAPTGGEGRPGASDRKVGQRTLKSRIERPRVIEFVPAEPRSAEEWFAVGVDAEDGGDLELAERAYRNALLLAGPDAEGCFNLGNVLYGLDRPAEASQRYLQAVEIDPNYVEAWNNLGNALALLDRYDDAIASYRQALSVEPHYADVHYNLAEALEQSDRSDEARAHWFAYLAEDSTSDLAAKVRRRLASAE